MTLLQAALEDRTGGGDCRGSSLLRADPLYGLRRRGRYVCDALGAGPYQAEQDSEIRGGYHGKSAEAQMSLAPETRMSFPQPVPDSAGIPQSVADQMLIAPFNDLVVVEALLAEEDDVAANILEPLQWIIPPELGYLQGLLDLCDRYDVLHIFDEIVTGFRMA